MKRRYPYDYGPCPYCGVGWGELCLSGNYLLSRRPPGATTKAPHPERIQQMKREN